MDEKTVRHAWEEVPNGESRTIGATRFTKHPKGKMLVATNTRWSREGHVRNLNVAVYPKPEDMAIFKNAGRALVPAGPSSEFPGSVGSLRAEMELEATRPLVLKSAQSHYIREGWKPTEFGPSWNGPRDELMNNIERLVESIHAQKAQSKAKALEGSALPKKLNKRYQSWYEHAVGELMNIAEGENREFAVSRKALYRDTANPITGPKRQLRIRAALLKRARERLLVFRRGVGNRREIHLVKRHRK
jgi:hypothetical protein